MSVVASCQRYIEILLVEVFPSHLYFAPPLEEISPRALCVNPAMANTDVVFDGTYKSARPSKRRSTCRRDMSAVNVGPSVAGLT